MQFVEVSLAEWDCAKVTVRKPATSGKANQNAEVTVLYDGKLPVLVIRSVDGMKPFILTSFKGLQENKVWVPASGQSPGYFLDTWDGDWSISFKICTSVKDASLEEKKLMQIYDDIYQKVKKVYKDKSVRNPINYSWIKEMNPDTDVEEIVAIDDSKAAYLKLKVAYEGTPNCATVVDKFKKTVPAITHDDRKPKAKFFDMSRARDKMLVQDPHKECQTGMNAIVKVFIGLYKATEGVYITKKLLQCYYNPVAIGGNAPDEDIIGSFRNMSVADLANQEQY